jgi:hypothetical protein
MLFKFALLFLLFLVSSLGPGLLLVRRLRWSPAEKLCGALGFSFCFLYCASFVIFCLGGGRAWHVGLAAICLALTAYCGQDLVRLPKSHEVRRTLGAFAVLFAWGLLLLALVRHYSGGICSIDWLEHYLRSRYFILHPAHPPVVNGLPLPSRPPLMNVVAGHFLALAGMDFELFQVTFLFLNIQIVFPLCLMMRLFARRGSEQISILVAFLMSNPLLWWNVTWTWTKVFTGFYVVLATWFYLAGLRKTDWIRIAAAFFFMGAAFLAHFSAGPYALTIGLHYVVCLARGRRQLWLAFFVGGLATLGLLATWFGYSAMHFGLQATLASNTTMLGFHGGGLRENAVKVIHNLVYSFIPHPLHVSRATFEESLGQPSSLGYLRDYFLMLCDPNFVLAMGTIGGFLVLYLLMRTWLAETAAADRRFWIPFILISAIAGIAAHPTEDIFGVAQICGQPLIYMGIAFLAAQFRTLPRAIRYLAVAGCLVDFTLGVWLQFHLESQRVELFALSQAAEQPAILAGYLPPDNWLSKWAGFNWKARVGAQVVYLGDHFIVLAGVIQLLVIAFFGVALTLLIRTGSRTLPTRAAQMSNSSKQVH